jgi:hypothetical protein
MSRALIAALLLLAVSLVGTAQAEVRHPNGTYFTAEELDVLLPALNRLALLLNDTELACGRWYPDQWTSLDFAAYSQGILAAEGFTSTLVMADGWPDGEHVWLLVDIPLAENIIVVPVETLPAAGHAQTTLGRIPLLTDASGALWYEDTYVRFGDVLELKENQLPIPVIGVTPLRGTVGEESTFFGLHSSDPDGEIVLWFWDFADGSSATGAIAENTFFADLVYMVTLTVYDNRGAYATTEFPYSVAVPPAPQTGGGCGCGG